MVVDPVNEQVVLAAAMVDPSVRRRLLETVRPESFFAKGHTEAWKAFGELEKRGLAYDPATVRQLAGEAVDTAYLDQLVELRPAVPPNLAHHVLMLAWDQTRIEATRGPVASLLELLRDPASAPEDVRTRARAVGEAFGMRGGLLLDSGQVAREQGALLEARMGGQACYPYGLDGLDFYDKGPKAGQPRMIRGAAPGKLTCITGLSGSGKSTVIGRMVLAQIEMGRRVLWGAWEEGAGDSLEQVAVMSLGLSRSAFSTGAFTAEECRAVREEMERLAPLVRFFALPSYERSTGGAQKWKSGSAANDKALDLIHENMVVSACDVFVADLWRRTVRAFEPDEEEVALYRQQDLAQKTNVHCILVHQQRLKDVEQRQDKRPTREGLKGSGAWVETVDTLIGVHRPALWKAVSDDTLQLLVLKQRRAPWPLAVEFTFDPDTASLTEGRGVEVTRELESSESVDRFLADDGPKRGRRPKK